VTGWLWHRGASTDFEEAALDEAREFSAHRDHLIAVAYRMLGSRSDAEDAVQEAWLRFAASDRADIEDLRGWLTTVTARICLDLLRSARVRREAYVGSWLPEPIVTRLPSNTPDPADAVAHSQEVSLALLVVLERLSPEQRVAFVLHDVFAVPFEEIARVLGTTAAAARQLASRARKAVTDARVRHRPDPAEQRRVLDAFLNAARRGDIDGLLAVLAPDVVATGDSNGLAPAARTPIPGAVRVGRFILGLFRQVAERVDAVVEPVLVNGDLGLLIEAVYPDGDRQLVVMGFAVADDRIEAIYNQLNPEKLTRVPRPDPARNLLALP
jgi:RNA polymerase sigma-70 factor (ECF subfamily)